VGSKTGGQKGATCLKKTVRWFLEEAVVDGRAN
jgi:hypothetical protein